MNRSLVLAYSQSIATYPSWRCLLIGVLLGVMPFASAWGQAGAINPISYFQTVSGQNMVYWSQTSVSYDAASHKTTVAYSDGSNGLSTMVWSDASTLTSWTITTGGVSQVYEDAATQGYPGGFVLSSGNAATCNVVAINGRSYAMNGTLLIPASNYDATVPASLVYGGVLYNLLSSGSDYSGKTLGVYDSGTAQCTTSTGTGLQISFPDGKVATYTTDSTGRFYKYQAASTAANQLTQIGGFTLTGNTSNLALPIPFQTFVYAGNTFTFSTCFFCQDDPGVTELACHYVNTSGTADLYETTDGNPFSLALMMGSTYCTLNQVAPGLKQYRLSPGSGGNPANFTAFDGIAYTAIGGIIMPRGPLASFSYGSGTYQFTGSSQAANGNFVSQYTTSGANPVTATAEYSSNTGALVKMTVNAPGGGNAIYVDGASVGQPGAYVWSNASTAANQLTSVNGNAFTPTGNTDLPSTVQTTNGIFQIKGDFLSLGTWSDNPNQSGFDVSYYDGQVDYPSTIEFTSNRPLATWDWDTVTADGTAVNPVMQLDQNSRLLLYPVPDPNATSVTGPVPTVTLDPNGTSEITGSLKVDGALIIPQQGDLSMGSFIATPSPTP